MAQGTRFVDRLLWLAGYVRADALKASGIQSPDWARAGLQPWTDEPNLTVIENQLNTMATLSWVYNSVSARAQTGAGTPLKVKQRVGEEQKDIDNHPFEMLLDRPNPLQSRTEFLTAWFGYRALAGNTYVWLNRTNPTAAPSEMWMIPPQSIRPVPDENLYLRGYVYYPGDGREIPLETWEISHSKTWHPTNRFLGLSPIEALGLAVESDIAQQKWNRNYFAKDNAKPAGALAYADPINDTDWARMKEDLKQDHGGSERKMMLIRNAGKGGVQWLQFGLSQKDMDFLASRAFTKEEIYSAIAPGLASILAVNATEANSLAGDKTFYKMCIWPDHQAIAERITTDILPAYGDNLRCEFDDVRISDRAIELQEQQAYEKAHTINEIRKEYYNDDPLTDERGDLLPAEITGPTGIGPTYKEPQPIPAQLQPFAGQQEQPDEMMQEEERNKKEADIPEDDDEQVAKADLLRWQRKVTKRMKAGHDALVDFDSELISDGLKCAVLHGLEHVETVDEVRDVFDRAIKARRTSNAPDDVERRRAERELQAIVEEFFTGQMKRIKKAVQVGA